MGTNFYHYAKPPCPTCGHEDEPRHIGKSSAGWCFSLHVYPDEGINDYADWSARFASGVIKDEYGDALTADEMRKRITNRWGRDEWPDGWAQRSGYASEEDFHDRNYSERGPRGLLRAKVDMRHCIGHGEGSWDLIVGDFS